MKKSLTVNISTIVLMGMLCVLPRTSVAETVHEFVGVKKCSICHKKDADGNPYQKWLDSAHSKAYATLGTDEAKKVGKKLGIEDPQKSGKCLKCHSTAYDFSEALVSETIPVEEGVSCESCHGAGKDYMKKSIMEDQAQSQANGLLIPDEQTCLKCHNPESPQYKPFHYSEAWEKIQHSNPNKK